VVVPGNTGVANGYIGAADPDIKDADAAAAAGEGVSRANLSGLPGAPGAVQRVAFGKPDSESGGPLFDQTGSGSGPPLATAMRASEP
jgi:hypothetical protein